MKRGEDNELPVTRPRKGSGWAVLFAAAVALSASRAFAFDDFPVGARPSAFSGAFAAVSDDVNSLYYNPAGLATMTSPQVTAYYTRLLPNLSDGSNAGLTFMAYGHPLGKDGKWGTAGAGYTELSLQGLFDEQTYTAGYAKTLPWMNISVGANAKILSRKYGETADTLDAGQTLNPAVRLGISDPAFNGGKSSEKTSFDLGALARPLPNLSVGASLLNVNTPDMGLSSTDRVPMVTRLGADYTFPFLKAVADLTRRRYIGGQTDNRIAAGVERGWVFQRYGELRIRGGAGIGSRAWRQISMGMGYEVNGFGIDYVYQIPLGSFSGQGNTQQISLSFRFGRAPGEEELSSLVREEREATARAEEALKMAQAEAKFVTEDRNKLLVEMEQLKGQVQTMQSGKPAAGIPATPAADRVGASSLRERSARDRAQREFSAAYQAAMAAYTNRTQRGATLVERIKLLADIQGKYQDKDVDVSRTKAELERVQADLAQSQADYKITWDFYKKTVSDGADEVQRSSLLERMVRKYSRAGIDISDVKKELEALKKK
jgi:hypothetical protein